MIKKLSFPLYIYTYIYIYTYAYLPTCVNRTRFPFIFFHFRRCYFCSAKRLFIVSISQKWLSLFISKQQQQQNLQVSIYLSSVLHVSSKKKKSKTIFSRLSCTVIVLRGVAYFSLFSFSSDPSPFMHTTRNREVRFALAVDVLCRLYFLEEDVQENERLKTNSVRFFPTIAYSLLILSHSLF